eukprot:jgi/Botrbrau1/4660/Bobra.33_2s0031.1
MSLYSRSKCASRSGFLAQISSRGSEGLPVVTSDSPSSSSFSSSLSSSSSTSFSTSRQLSISGAVPEVSPGAELCKEVPDDSVEGSSISTKGGISSCSSQPTCSSLAMTLNKQVFQ